MTETQLRQALQGLFAVCVLSSAVESLVTDSGAAQALRLACGTVIALSVARLISTLLAGA